MMLVNKRNIVITLMAFFFLFTGGGHAAATPDLGRLFTSTVERSTLDRLRRQDLIQNELIRAREDAGEEKKGSDTLVINGVVQRSNGDKTVWINGKKVENKKGPNNVRLHRGPDHQNKVVVGIPGRRAVSMKPGQRWNPGSGKVVEIYSADDRHAVKP